MEEPQAILPQQLSELSELDKPALLEIIIRQNQQLQERWQQHESLRKQVEELEKASKGR